MKGNSQFIQSFHNNNNKQTRLKMKKDFLLKYILAAGLVIMLLASFFYYQENYAPEFKDEVLAITKDIEVLDLKLNQSVFASRFGLPENDEKIQGYLTALEQKQQLLNDGEYNLKNLGDETINAELQGIAYRLREKKQIIESFNSDSQLFLEANDSFQQLTYSLNKEDNLNTQIKNKIYHLQEIVLLSFIKPQPESMNVTLKELSKLSAEKGGIYKKQLELLAAQAKSISHYGINARQLINTLMTEYSVLSVNLEKNIRHYFKRKSNREYQLQTGLFVISILSVFYVVYLLFRLARKSNALSEVLKNVEKYQFALNQHAIVSAADVKGNITYVNDKFCEISGFAREELMGQNHRMIKSSYHEKEVFVNMWRTICRGEVWHGQIKNRKKGEGFYWVNGTIVPFLDQKGKPYQYISIRTDITHQKNLEKQLFDGQHFMEKVTGTMAQGVYALDMNGICTFWNTEAEHILGWRAEELIGKKLHDIIYYQDEKGNRLLQEECITHKSIQDKKTYSSDAGTFTHKDGGILSIAITAVPLIEDDRVIGSVAVFNDITKRKADEKLLTEAIVNAKQASQAKSEFLANMSHEIRTPMNGIIGMTDLALETELTDEQQEYLEIVKDSSCALLAIINDILDFSKIEAGKIVLQKVDFFLNSLMEKTLLMLAQRAEQKGIKLVSNIAIDSGIPLHLIGDPGRLRQVLINLIGNAIKFTMEGSVTVNVTLQEKNDQNCCLLFSVTDTGIGIAKNKQSSVFDSFSQADSSVSRKFGGTGLGLSISKQFIELMGGEIWLESEEHVGTTFSFTSYFDYNAVVESAELIDSVANELPDKEQSTLAVKAGITVTNGESKQLLDILLAEDNLINQKLAKKLLEKQGHKIHIANNGLEAVDLFQKQDFDLILMDFQMPEMNGLEATGEIRKLEVQSKGHIPIIAMTANAMKEDRERALAAGMDAYVPKPININELLTEIAVFFPAKKESPQAVNTVVDDGLGGLMVCNWGAALERLGGEAEILEMMTSMFLEEERGYLENIKNALAQEDAPLLERELHTLKGVCSTIGAEKVEKLVKTPEKLAAKGQFSDVAIAIEGLEKNMDELNLFLKEKLKLSEKPEI
ncbi:MAG: PAS domain S-box protein [Methylococcaceae bacterium]|nr:PAS domain S-box protein [Methylococcaceae bacterium]